MVHSVRPLWGLLVLRGTLTKTSVRDSGRARWRSKAALDTPRGCVIFEGVGQRRLLRKFFVYCCVSALLGPISATALAAPISRLTYAKGSGADSCPGPMQLRLAVIARLGYDPFSVTANQTVIANIVRDGETLRAKIDLVNAEGSSQGVRQLTSPLDRCSELIRAMALSISIALDPEAALGHQEAPPTAAGASDDTPKALRHGPELSGEQAPTHEAVPEKSHMGRAIRYFTGLGVHATFGQAPGIGYGSDLFIGGRIWRFSLAFEGRIDALQTDQVNQPPINGEVGAMFLLASVVPCLHWGPVAACGVASTGVIRARSNRVSHPATDSAQYSVVGARLGLDLPVSGAWSLMLHADGQVPIPKQTIEINENSTVYNAWQSSSLAGLVGVALAVHY
jgi:hypothetical protein